MRTLALARSGRSPAPGPPHPDKCNDYIAAVVRSAPERFIGFASVNPKYQGTRRAVEELERAVTELGLVGVKLYPMYCSSPRGELGPAMNQPLVQSNLSVAEPKLLKILLTPAGSL